MKELVIDISHADPDIDISEWKDERGIWAVIAKCGGYEILPGNNHPEEFRTRIFDRHYRDTVANGLHVGSYYYSVATDEDTMRHNADHCASLLDGKSFDMPIYLDIEDPGQFELSRRDLTDVILAFIHRMEEHGYTAGLYTGRSALNGCMYGEELEQYPLWIAEYSDRCRTSIGHGMWQFGAMSIDGDVYWGDRDGYVDANWCYIDYPSKISHGSNVGDDYEWEPDDDLRQQVVDKARACLGDAYFSMNYSAAEGFNGWMGTNYIGQGWGCAQLCAYCVGTVVGVEYAGSVWSFAGDALGDEDNNQGGDFYFVDDPLPGDVVCYLAKYHNGEDAGDFSHAAVYIGDDMVIGSWGTGKPGEAGYWPGRGVSEDHISEQSLGNGWRFVRCRRLDEDTRPKRKGRTEVPYEGVGAVYRLNDNGTHLFTASLDEARNASEWMDYEGVAFRVSGKGRDVYRLYDDGNGDHFLTADPTERDRAKGWMSDEGVAFTTSGPVPVHRLCDESTNVHFYTTSVSERDACSTWMRYEGVAFNALSSDDSIEYAAHVQTHGWMDPVVDGMVAGTEGESKRIEALLIDPPKGFVIDVMAHVQRRGDMWFRGLGHGNTTVIGTTGKGLRMEGLRIDVKARDNDWVGDRKIEYRTHVQRIGWTDWCREGTYCGTTGKSLRVEAVQIRLA